MIPMSNVPRLVTRIDIDAIISNWQRLKDLSGKAETAAVVKADAYGHGSEMVARALYHSGCRVFFTTDTIEAARLRPYVGDSVIGYYDGLSQGDEEAIIEHNLIPTINHPEQIEILKGLSTDAPPKAMLQIDTGMNRLGVCWQWFDEKKSAKLASSADWRLVYSHLDSAADSVARSILQRERFDQVIRYFPLRSYSLAASGGILLGKDYHYHLTRPGIALYGYPPLPTTGFTPALTLEGRVLQIRHAKRGETVGYSATHTLTRDSTLATVAGGFADGFRRALSGRGRVYYGVRSAPVLGRVSMDSHVVDITDWPSGIITTHDYMTLISPQHDAEGMAALAGTHCYEILTSLGLRTSRTYTGSYADSNTMLS